MSLKDFIENLHNTFSDDENTKKTALENLENLHSQSAVWHSLYIKMVNAYMDQESA